MRLRQTARILLFNDFNKILLFNMVDQISGHPIWFTVGGGLKENETYEDAAKRELWEETGLALEDVEWGPVVWIREVDHLINGEPTRFNERYFVARTKKADINIDHFTDQEKQGYLSHYWWSLDELQISNELIFPRRLAELLRPILKGEFPESPISIE